MWVLSLCSSPHPEHVLQFESEPYVDPPVTMEQIPIEIVILIACFIDDPIEYFRFKRACRRFNASLRSQITISGIRLWELRNSRSPPLQIEFASVAFVVVPPLCEELVGFCQRDPPMLLNAMHASYSDQTFVHLFQPPVTASEYFLSATASHAYDFNFLKKLAMIATSGYDIRLDHVCLNLARDSHLTSSAMCS